MKCCLVPPPLPHPPFPPSPIPHPQTHQLEIRSSAAAPSLVCFCNVVEEFRISWCLCDERLLLKCPFNFIFESLIIEFWKTEVKFLKLYFLYMIISVKQILHFGPFDLKFKIDKQKISSCCFVCRLRGYWQISQPGGGTPSQGRKIINRIFIKIKSEHDVYSSVNMIINHNIIRIKQRGERHLF